MSKTDLELQLDVGWRIRQSNFPPQIIFSYPLDTALVSLTGAHCALQCAHCAGHYLRHMQPIQTAKVGRATSVLISGGCDSSGCVPVSDYLERIEQLNQDRRLNWHVGLIDEQTMRTITPYVNTISFDLVGDKATIHEVYGLNKTPQDYVQTYEMLCQYARVVPHITIGLLHSQLRHERPAMEMLAQLVLDHKVIVPAIVFIVFIPTLGTPYADFAPPKISEVALLLAEARQRFPAIPLHLGCMRPRGDYRSRLDPLAVRAGVNVLVSPSRKAREQAEQLGLQIIQTRECCVFD
jgi:uncharacterized radical SAM superfamily protein